MDNLQFGEFQLDVLKEVGNIGAGHAATALSRLLEKPVDMQVPQVKLVPFEEIADSVGGPENVVLAVFLRVEGDTPGNMFFILPLDSAKKLLYKFAGLIPTGGDGFSELELSAMNEIGNILAGSYLSSLADLTHLQMVPTVPSLAVDMAGAILSYGLLQFGHMGDQALFIDTKFLQNGDAVEGHFFFIPDPESFNRIFVALGVSGA
ncbi:chemotaxis protein CheC [Gorillibacterium massiliense]|uniref:chemotaxis protein CheC n=1 Tax=Gorillibacterium massiliense TaxID=1280390 RepID=UPI0004ADA6FE|nr:chemotaxis protein CheC [Gorillibacterium massiliense]